jgi:hypothetical protein
MKPLCTFLAKPFLPVVSFFFFASTIFGAVRNYCPVPFWDMWDSDIGFYEQVSRGRWDAWWAPHAEHWILFSKLFFWLDHKYLHGLSLLLILLNLVLMSQLWLGLFLGTRALLKENPNENLLIVAGSWLALICFSWMQKENITWAFQSQFFAACLFPMLAFQCMALSASTSRSRLWFGMALLCGLISVGTLASGLLALPLIVLMTIVLRQPRPRIMLAAVATLCSIVPYPKGAIGVYGSPINNLQLHAAEAWQFFLSCLGGPFRVIANDFFVGRVAGAVFLVGFAHCALLWFQRKERNPMFLAFVIFLSNVIATALATTSGRVIFGIDSVAETVNQPIPTAGAFNRYLTFPLLGWAVLSILIGYYYREHSNFPGAALVLSLLFPLLLLPSQLDSIRGDPSVIKHQHLVAALALDLGVNDKETIRAIYPVGRIYGFANEASRRHLSVFGLPTFRNARGYLKQEADTLPLRQCRGHIDAIVPLNGQDGVSRMRGWAFDEVPGRVPQEVFLVKENDKIVAVGLTGSPRADVEQAVNRKAGLSGFDGYLFGGVNNVRLLCTE